MLTRKMHYSFIKQVTTSNLNALGQSASNSEWRRLPSSSLLQSHQGKKQILCVSPNISGNATYRLAVMLLSLTHVLEGIESG